MQAREPRPLLALLALLAWLTLLALLALLALLTSLASLALLTYFASSSDCNYTLFGVHALGSLCSLLCFFCVWHDGPGGGARQLTIWANTHHHGIPTAQIDRGLPRSIGLVSQIQWTSSLKNINYFNGRQFLLFKNKCRPSYCVFGVKGMFTSMTYIPAEKLTPINKKKPRHKKWRVLWRGTIGIGSRFRNFRQNT